VSCDERFHNITAADNNVLILTDAWITVTEKYDDYEQVPDLYSASITIVSWDIISMVEDIQLIQNSTNAAVSGDVVNVTSLYEEYVRSGGYQNWCRKDNQVERIYPGFRARRNCSCDEACYLFASCCPDAAYHQYRRCTPAYFGPTGYPRPISMFHSMISRCPTSCRNAYLKERCERLEDYDLFNIPVFNVQTKETYRNIYCVVCHDQNNLMTQTFRDLKPWNVSIACPRLMHTLFMSSMKSILRSAEENDCTIYFTSTNAVESCVFLGYEVADVINKCNVTGMAMTVSEDAQNLCEDPTMIVMAKSLNYKYRNQICDMCNSKTFEDPISKCYLEEHLKPNYSQLTLNKCEHGNEDDMAQYPYRNTFCQECNDVSHLQGRYGYREIFSYSRNSFQISNTKPYKVPDLELPEIPLEQCNERDFMDVYEVCMYLILKVAVSEKKHAKFQISSR
jgi:hypothetical protein